MNIANDKYKFDEIFLICMIFSKIKAKKYKEEYYLYFSNFFYDSTFCG